MVDLSALQQAIGARVVIHLDNESSFNCRYWCIFPQLVFAFMKKVCNSVAHENMTRNKKAQALLVACHVRVAMIRSHAYTAFF